MSRAVKAQSDWKKGREWVDDELRISSSMMILPALFYREFELAPKRNQYKRGSLPRILAAAEQRVKDHGLELLLIPAFVGGNHEIMAYVNFEERSIGYGAFQRFV